MKGKYDGRLGGYEVVSLIYKYIRMKRMSKTDAF